MLPEVHGFDIARRIKASERYAHIPVIMVSAVYRGWRFAEDMRESYGVEHYLEKPFKIADVMRAVESCLEAEEEPSSQRVREMSAEAEKELNAGVAAYQAGRIDDAVVHLRRGYRHRPAGVPAPLPPRTPPREKRDSSTKQSVSWSALLR